MTAGPTPPPHTPMAFLKGGAGGLFTAKCVELCSKAGYDTDDFGSYDYVDKRIKDAKKKVNLANDAKYGVPRNLPDDQRNARQRELDKFRAKNGANARPPAPTPHERSLAGCQSGHLVMNSSYQRERENPCTSVVDGFEDNLAPCIPHEGRTSTAGTEHHWVYHNEINQPRARGLTPEPGGFAGCTDPAVGQAPPVPPHRYSAADIDADESARIRNNPRLRGEPPGTPASGGGSASGAGAAPATTGTPGATGAVSSPTGPGASSTPLWQQQITGETAAECIDNFRKAAMAAMKSHCAQSVAENRLAASGGDPSKTPAQYQQECRDRITAAEAAGDKKAAGEARTDLRDAQHANCRAVAGARLGPGGTPQNDARCPAGSPATTHENSHGAEVPVNLFGPDVY